MDRYRHEYKYLINAFEENILRIIAGGIMQRDFHAGMDGSYRIRSLYFDDLDDSCYLENESGTDPRSKFRIRYYNNDPCRIQLEKKSKCRGMTYKERCFLTVYECQQIMAGRLDIGQKEISGIKQRLLLEMALRKLEPKVIVTYERIPFVYSGGNIRVTFDKNITSSDEVSNFLEGGYRQRPIFAKGGCVLEVKWDEVLPLHIRESLQLDTLQWTAFSKYHMCRFYHL